jgi:hypothetical protein
VRSTSVLEVEPGVLGASDRVVVKLEQLQHTGSFKPRGAFNRMLSERVPRAGVVAASGGNFGAAVAYAASVLGHAAELFVPETTPTTKVNRLRGFGGGVVVTSAFYADALAEAERRCRETRHARDDRHGWRVRAMIIVLRRAGLRVWEALALAEHDLDPRRGSLLVRNGKGPSLGGRHGRVGAGSNSARGWPRAPSCPSARCSASSTAPPAAGRGRVPPSARSSAGSPPTPALGAASLGTSCATRMRSNSRARVCR